MLVVFLNHAVNHGVDLGLLFEVLFMSLLSKEVGLVDLLLDLLLVRAKLVKFLLVLLPLLLIADLFVTEDGHIDLSVLFLQALVSKLATVFDDGSLTISV